MYGGGARSEQRVPWSPRRELLSLPVLRMRRQVEQPRTLAPLYLFPWTHCSLWTPLQVEQPEWHLSWGIRLGEVLLPQLSIFGLANDDDDEEEEEEVVEVGRGGISVTSNRRGTARRSMD